MKKKILFVTHSGELGGAESKMLTLIQDTKFECEILILSDGKLAEKAKRLGIKTQTLLMPKLISSLRKGTKSLDYSFGFSEMKNFLVKYNSRKDDFDFIVCMSQKAHFLTLMSKIPKDKIIWFMNDRLNRDYFGFLAFNFIKISSKFTKYPIILNSKISKDDWHSAKARKNNIHIIPSGIDTTLYDKKKNNSDKKIAEIKDNYHSSADNVISLVGRICEWKGQDLAIEAIKDIDNAVLLIIGGAQFAGDELYEKFLKNKVQSYRLEKKIFFMGHVDNISDYLFASDLVIHCSTIPEPFGRVIVEGMLAEKIVLAPNSGGPLEILEEGKTGYFYKMGSIESLKTKIKEIFNKDKSDIETVAKNARAEALENYSSEMMTKKFEEILENVSE